MWLPGYAEEQSYHTSAVGPHGKKYPCAEFDSQFAQKGNLNKHKQSVHMGEKYPCKECDYQFAQKGNLTKHQ